MTDCCNEMGCRRKKPIKLMRSDLTGTWYFVTDYTKAKHGDDTWRATTKHEVDPAQARQLEAMRDAERLRDDIGRLTRERDEWEANEQESSRDVVRLEAETTPTTLRPSPTFPGALPG